MLKAEKISRKNMLKHYLDVLYYVSSNREYTDEDCQNMGATG